MRKMLLKRRWESARSDNASPAESSSGSPSVRRRRAGLAQVLRRQTFPGASRRTIADISSQAPQPEYSPAPISSEEVDVSSPATSTASDRQCWVQRAGLASGVEEDPVGLAKTSGRRQVPRFLRPVLVLLTVSLAAIACAKLGRGLGAILGPAAYAAGGVKLQEAVVDDIFDRADRDKDGVIANEEIKQVRERRRDELGGER